MMVEVFLQELTLKQESLLLKQFIQFFTPEVNSVVKDQDIKYQEDYTV
jgi:hypothetical protein